MNWKNTMYWRGRQKRQRRAASAVFSLYSQSATVWVTRDGRITPVREMSYGHIVNTVRMLRRRAWTRLRDQDLWDSSVDDVVRSRVPAFDLMLEELARRAMG